MALYDGFFDAVLNEETGEYDRAYSSGDFTGYFANLIGSGVCVHENPDSFKAEFEGEKLYLRKGYLFIQGYWLANAPGADEDPAAFKGYEVTLPGGATYAIVAHLNLGKKMIEIETRSVSQAYPDSLVLAIVSPASAEDTRHNTDICGTIETAGDLSQKVEWAISYIDNEIEDKLKAAEDTIKAQEQRLDSKIAEVQATVDRIAPPPVGSIKFSASQDVGPEWLRCDGSFVNEVDYPELVAALGKLTPSGDKFELISSGEIGPQITNGVVYDGRMWVYSYGAKKLYGVDLEGTVAVKEIAITSEDERFNDFIAPTTARPLCLSIVPHGTGSGAKLFLTQIIQDGTLTTSNWDSYILIFSAKFSDENDSISLVRPFLTLTVSSGGSTFFMANAGDAIPYVTSFSDGGVETYHLAPGFLKVTSSAPYNSAVDLRWSGDSSAQVKASTDVKVEVNHQRVSFGKKSSGEAVFVSDSAVGSIPNGLFSGSISGKTSTRNTYGPVNIAGSDGVIFSFDKNEITRCIMSTQSKSTITLSGIPPAARVFVDGGAYLWGKDIYMIFVGTGIIFSRTLEEGSFGYLDTTSVLGTITQFGYLDYSQDEGTLYLLGQDTSNCVKVAKIVLNTLYDYANDGAWLPMIASDGVPAYIKAKEDGGGVITDPVDISISVELESSFSEYADLIFNGEILIAGKYTRTVSRSGMFSVGLRIKKMLNVNASVSTSLNGTKVATATNNGNLKIGDEKTASFKVSDYTSNTIALKGVWG